MVENICKECNEVFGGRKKKYCSDECFRNMRRRYNRELYRKQNTPKPDVTIICEQCGIKHTVPPRTAHQARFCSTKCNDTWHSRQRGHKPLDEWEQERDGKKQIRQSLLARERALRGLRRSLTRVIRKKEDEQKVLELTRNCDECDITFYDPHPNVLTCSTSCSRSRKNRLQRLYMNDRYNEYNLIDKDITLEVLYERDEGLCYLCDELCNYEDHERTVEGYYIAGASHPSIDHVIPISKGGLHAWNNVKLAHHRCNTLKRDNMIMEKETV